MGSKLTLCGLIVLFLVLQLRLWVGTSSIHDISRLNSAMLLQKEEIEKLKTRNRYLDLEVQALKKQPEALEERARAELGMIKRGETFYLVIEPR